MPIKDKLTIRLGPLAPPLAKACDETGETPSEFVRRCIADELGVPPPDMAERAAAARERTAESMNRFREPLTGLDGDT